MARRNNGWVALSRKLIRSWIWNDPEYLKMWCWLIMSANYERSQVYWRGAFKNLERGQIITSKREIAKECQVDIAKAGRFLSALESEPQSEPQNGPQNEPQISSQKSPRGSIITILNYEKYQSSNKSFDRQDEPQSEPQNEPQSEPQSDPIITIKQTNKKTISLPPISDFALELGERWLSFGLQAHPQYANKWTAEKFGVAIDEVIRKGPFTPEQMEAVFQFIQKDQFWQENARSPATLLKKSQKNGLRKIDNIFSKIPRKQKTFEELMREYDDKNAGTVSNLA